jgi:FG-GAP repeat
MRLLVLAALLVPTAALSAQVSAYTWTFKGNPGGSGQVVGDTLHLVGANDGSTAQYGHVSWLEASTSIPIHVTATCQYINTDDCENDAPVWLIDGAFTKPDTGGCWGTNNYAFSFDVLPGHSFGFGIWTSDAILGAGSADIVNFTATPYTWFDWAGGIDPQPWFTTTDEADGADALCGLGDVDGDGVRELVVSSHTETSTVYSGATGQKLYALAGLGSGGNPVDDAGDVNGDGTPDFVIGLPFANGQKGRVEVRSGAHGALVFGYDPAGSEQEWLGTGVAGLGDVDGDGYDDVAAGSPFALAGHGEVLVLGGPDGHVLHDLVGPGGVEQFGRHVAALDDVDLDGVPDFAVTQQGGSFARVIVDSGATGSQITVANESQVASGLNTSFIASAGDFDADGKGDIAWWLNPAPLNGGKVTIRSGATGAELYAWPKTTASDEDLSTVTAGDVNGDGFVDIAYSAFLIKADGGHVVVNLYSGAGSHPLLQQFDTANSSHGAVVRAFGDVDHDGAADLAVGRWGPTEQTRVLHALDGNGPPNLHGNGTLVAGTPMALVVKDGKANAPWTLVVGVTYLGAPFKGGTLVPQPLLLVPGVLNGFGRGTISATWPSGLGPVLFWAQGWIVDSDAAHGLSATNGLSGAAP